jgi:hypothetical protein
MMIHQSPKKEKKSTLMTIDNDSALGKVTVMVVVMMMMDGRLERMMMTVRRACVCWRRISQGRGTATRLECVNVRLAMAAACVAERVNGKDVAIICVPAMSVRCETDKVGGD